MQFEIPFALILAMGRIILVSNRLPVTVRQGRRGAQELSVSSGGLVAGLNPLHERRNGIWIGHPGEEPDHVTSVALVYPQAGAG